MKMTISGKVEKSSLETNDKVQLSCKILKKKKNIYIYIYIYILIKSCLTGDSDG